MRCTYDREADAAYLHVADAQQPGTSVRQVWVPDQDGVQGQFILDLDQDGRLLGIEVLFASEALPRSVLNAAQS